MTDARLHENPREADPSRPLLGLRVLNTRLREDGEELSRRLAELGAEPVSLPTTRIAPPDDAGPLDAAIRAIAAGSPLAPAFDWIGFTSAHAVSAFMDRLLQTQAGASQLDARTLAGIRLAVVGPATADALRRYGLSADLVPDRGAGRHLASALGDVAGQRILLPRSDIALRDLPEALAARGAAVTEVVAYTTRPAPADPAALQVVLAGRLHAATFFSPSALDGLAAQVAPRRLDGVLQGVAVVCVGETTAQAASGRGLTGVIPPARLQSRASFAP